MSDFKKLGCGVACSTATGFTDCEGNPIPSNATLATCADLAKIDPDKPVQPIDYCPSARLSCSGQYGYGFAPDDIKDPAATVEVFDCDNNLVCYIYTTSAAGHTIEIKDCDGVLAGYAANTSQCACPCDIPESSLVSVTPIVTGNPIATVNVDGTDYTLSETITEITALDFDTGTATLSLTFLNETGVPETTEVEIPVKVAVEHISPEVINPANTYLNYSNQIVVDANGNFYGFNAAGVPTKLNITETVTTITNVQAAGKVIATHKNEQLALVDIKESVTGLTATYNAATQSIVLTHTNENGAQPAISVGIGSLYPDTSVSVRGLVNLTSLQHLGAGDKLINGVRIGKGGTEASITNTIVGNTAGYAITTATSSTGMGNNALQALTTGAGNTAYGHNALSKVTTGVQNVAIGSGAMGNTANNVNRLTAVGTNAMNNITTGTVCTAVGWQALFANTTGSNNIAIGDQAIRNNTTGNFNIGIGASVLTNSNGTGNLGFGQAALFNNTTGGNNTAIGSFSMFFNTTGLANLAFGNNAMRANTTGSSNTVVGTSGLWKNTTGNFNTAMGDLSLSENLTGLNNSAFGRGALNLLTSFSNSSGLGAAAQVTGSNQVQLGDALTTTYVYGTVQNRSDARDKTEIADTVLGLDFINALRPVDYKWDLREDYRPAPLPEDATEEEQAEWLEANSLTNIVRDGSKTRNRKHHGLIAQEVKALIDSTGVDFGGFQDHTIAGGEDAMSLGYDELIAPLIKAVQQLSAKVQYLEQQLQGNP